MSISRSSYYRSLIEEVNWDDNWGPKPFFWYMKGTPNSIINKWDKGGDTNSVIYGINGQGSYITTVFSVWEETSTNTGMFLYQYKSNLSQTGPGGSFAYNYGNIRHRVFQLKPAIIQSWAYTGVFPNETFLGNIVQGDDINTDKKYLYISKSNMSITNSITFNEFNSVSYDVNSTPGGLAFYGGFSRNSVIRVDPKLLEGLIFTTSLDSTDTASIKAYLNNKWDLGL